MKNSKILCTICVRGGSKGLKNKNIKLLNNIPLIAHTIKQAQKSELFDQIVVSTDSDQIMKIAKEYNAEVFFKRSEELSNDTAGKVKVIQDAFKRSEAYFNTQYDYHFDLDATSPLRLVSDIYNAFNQFLKNDYDLLQSGMIARKSPYFNLVELNKDNHIILSKELKEPILRRQDSPKCYDLNASIYIWKRNTILNYDTVFVDNSGLYIMPEERSIDIDTQLDFDFVEFIMKREFNEKM